MGWASGVDVFDAVVEAILEPEAIPDKKHVIRKLIEVLEDGDWDTQSDSLFWDHPVVRSVFRELHPEWDWEDKG